jgi:hypothetical protein
MAVQEHLRGDAAHGIVRLGQEKLADLIISHERGIDRIGCYRWK